MYRSRPIKIGNLYMGGDSSLIIQSMVNTDTNNIEASVNQCKRIFDAGGDIVRITTQSLKEVISLKKIRDELRRSGYNQPLVADVHFQPRVAEEAAKIVEKVRINPGNYIERKYSGPRKISAIEQRRQTEIIREKIKPLIRICKEHNTAIRIGVNHGSLSERILNWYGNSPEGMVESAMEFIRVFHDEKFENLVISLKASNTRLMVYANRLLIKRMIEEDYYFPIHLGVTEAGDEEDGRIKSAMGIGALLTDGIGDTLRVSLTEDPELEIPVAKMIREIFGTRKYSPDFILEKSLYFDPYHYKRRISLPSEQTGGKNPPVVFFGSGDQDLNAHGIEEAGYQHTDSSGLTKGPQPADFIFLGDMQSVAKSLTGVKIISSFKQWCDYHKNDRNYFPLVNWKNYGLSLCDLNGLHFIEVSDTETPGKFYELLESELFGAIILTITHEDPIHHTRNFFKLLGSLNNMLPVILHKKYNSRSKNELIIKAATELGSLFNDGFGDGIWIEEENTEIGQKDIREISFGILQASGTRISKTEYISCPSCGRTLFDIQNTLHKIKEATTEFVGLKIAVMGCIVNGLGEMADADYGYIGSGMGLVSLYKGREQVKKNIPEEFAVDELVKLIKGSS